MNPCAIYTRRSPLRAGIGRLGLTLLLAVSLQPTWAQYFGQNKIGYRMFEFKKHQTRNFELIHYLRNDSVRRHWLTQSEHWYSKLQQVLGDSIPFPNPVVLYANHADFQQTNVTPGPIDPGTGGFAETVKNRIVMPIAKANAQTDHVLGHEIVHAMQFQMMRHDSLSITGLFQLPLWFVEGQAEYLSIGPVDSHTALWMRDAVRANDLPTLNDLTTQPRFFPYRWGHAFWAFVTGTWGEQTVRPLLLTASRFGYETAIQRVLGVTPAEFTRRWHAALRAHYALPTERRAAVPGTPLLPRGGRMQLAPALSPDGRYVAFLSEKSLFSIDLFLADARTGRVLRKLLSTTRHAHLDALSYLESSGTWSPDGRLFGFVAFAQGRNRLVLVEPATGRIRRQIELPGVPAFSNPAWSPDGRHLVVNGLVDGQPDLYLYHWETGTVRQLTNDRFAELQAAWSPDGRTLVFATDRPAKSDNRPFAFDHRLAIYDVATDVRRDLEIFAGADNLNPVFGTDNQTIYFLSNQDGYRDLYAHNPYRNETYRLTRLGTGITGITPHAPVLSIAQQTGQFAYSVFERQGYRLFLAESGDLLWESLANRAEREPTASILPPVPRFTRDFTAARLNASRPADLVPTLSDTARALGNRFSLIHLGNGSDVSVNTNRFGTSLAGGVNAVFGDFLNDRQISTSLSVAGELADVAGQVTYINRRRHVNWGLSLSHVPFRSGRTQVVPDFIESEGRQVPVQRVDIDVQRTFEQQLSLFSYLPMSRTRRFEFNMAASRLSFVINRTSEYFFRGQFLGTERTRLPSPPDLYSGQIGAAYVGDNTTAGPVAPLKGHRFRIGLDGSLGPVQLQTFLFDYRQYLRLNRVTLAFRGLHTARYGRDASSGLLPPLFVGFPTLVRGYAAPTYLRNPYGGDGDVSLNDLQGSRMAVGNVELRLPLTGHPRIALFRSGLFPSEISLFTDAGLAWGRAFPDRPGAPDPSGRRVPVLSSGVSLRLNLLGAAILEPFYALPWQRTGGNRGVLGLNLAAGW
jgi:hypothetical protein